MTAGRHGFMKKILYFLPVLVLTTAGCSYKPPFLTATPLIGYKPDAVAATQLIEDAAQTLEDFALQPELRAVDEYLPAARGVFIVPRIRASGVAPGFNLGPGVLLVRTRDGGWSGPAFHDLISGAFTPHLPDRRHGAVFVFRSDPVLAATLAGDGRLDAAPEALVGVVGAIYHVRPQYDPAVNILVFTAADVANDVREPFTHAQLRTDTDLNEGLYGRGATPGAILYGTVGEPATNHSPATTRRLRAALGP